MKVLFISGDPNIFDEKSAVHARMHRYAHEFGELHIVNRADSLIEIEDGPLHIHGVPASKLQAGGKLAWKAHELILEKNIEIVSAQDPFELGRAALKAVAGTAAKLHIQVHTDFLSPYFVSESGSLAQTFKNRVRRIFADGVLPHANGIRAVSERVKRSLIERYGNRIPLPTVLPITVELQTPLDAALPSHSFGFTYLFAGRLEPEKRIGDILTALVRVRQKHDDVGLFIVGEGSERTLLERKVQSLGLSGAVIFLGARDGDVRALMASADGYVQASAFEGYSRTLIEAALAGTPIVSTDVGIIGEVISSEDAYIAPPANPAALAEKMNELYEDQGRTKRALQAQTDAQAHVERYADLPVLIERDLRAV